MDSLRAAATEKDQLLQDKKKTEKKLAKVEEMERMLETYKAKAGEYGELDSQYLSGNQVEGHEPSLSPTLGGLKSRKSNKAKSPHHKLKNPTSKLTTNNNILAQTGGGLVEDDHQNADMGSPRRRAAGGSKLKHNINRLNVQSVQPGAHQNGQQTNDINSFSESDYFNETERKNGNIPHDVKMKIIRKRSDHSQSVTQTPIQQLLSPEVQAALLKAQIETKEICTQTEFEIFLEYVLDLLKGIEDSIDKIKPADIEPELMTT